MLSDDKAQLCMTFILTHLQHATHPLIVGINGLQGIGKTTLVTALSTALSAAAIPHATFSVDDFYLPRAAQAALAANFPANPLLQHRGEPGTHAVPLLRRVLDDLRARRPTRVPRYDKAAFGGRGDRLPEDQWTSVNRPGEEPVRVVLFEGWCVGFTAASDEEAAERHRDTSTRTLCKHRLQDLLQINSFLKEYDAVTGCLDAFIHLDAKETTWVYDWRLEQERELRAARGTGMTDEEVIRFVDGYYPAYELYLPKLANGYLPTDGTQRNLRIVVDKHRSVLDVTTC
ncbi:hypothetical protein TD95_005471 [Thielaviopsis punctulata]|uniref:SRP54-type proteins GTP-binding domain-containing protein n=1 Tax=Thielaviopsis punctulata TaxID=72032 RepID=A0A0F4Z745_9PEZI|nr:hypothetical protein TD95_005471 [Thielaviopsis punctulata]